QLFLDRVTTLDGFDGLVDQMEELFLSDELMYQNGDYIPVLDAELAELAAGAADRSTDRLFMYGEASKSGLTVLKLDSVHVDIQNILPRRTKAFIYKKSIFDRSGALIEFPD